MSRYSNSGGSTGSDNNNYDDDDVQLKLQPYAAINAVGDRVGYYDSQFGDRFIVNFDDVDVLDGVVFQREDSPDTWKIFSAGKWFNLNPEDGLVYESYDANEGEYSGQMSAQDVLDHPRVLGFSETFGGDDYFYKPVGVVIEEAGEVALNDELIGSGVPGGLTEAQADRARSEAVVPVGNVSMLLGNRAWTRTLAKKITASGEAAIAGGDDKYDDNSWFVPDQPELRDELDGREMELWITEVPNPGDSDGTHTRPNLMDVRTGNQVTIKNGIEEGDSGSDTPASSSSSSTANQSTAATDGGEPDSAAESETDDGGDGDGGDEDESAAAEADGLPDDVPQVLDDLLDYFARTQGSTDAAELREFAADEVENPDDVDWEAAAAEVEARA